MKPVFHLTLLSFLAVQADGVAVHKRSFRHRHNNIPSSFDADLDPNVIQVVAAFDNSYAMQALTMLKSLAQNHQPGEVNVTAFVDGMQEKDQSDFMARANALCPGVLLTLLPAPPAMDGDAEPYKGFTYISNVTMVRLQIPHILPAEIQKVIYLDVDLVTKGSLRPLWQGRPCRGSWNTTDSPGICARSTLKYDSEWLTDMLMQRDVVNRTGYELFSSKQFNAGVLLLDLNVLRQNEFTAKIRRLLRESSVNDQDALNLYAMGMHAELNQEWNAMVYFADGAGSNFLSMQNPVIVHYDGPLKPWACTGVEALRGSAKHWADVAVEWPPAGCEHKVQKFLASECSRKSPWDLSKDRTQSTPPASTDKDFTWAWNALPRMGANAASNDALVVWTSMGAPPQGALESVAQLVKSSEPRIVKGLCSTPACVTALRAVGVRADLIWLRELVMPFSLRRWFQDHVRQKVLIGSSFPARFHQAVVLAALYTHGGLYVDINGTSVQQALPKEAWNGKWVLAHESGWQGLWSACRFPSHAPEVLDVAEGFAAATAESGASLAKLQSAAVLSVPHWSDAWAPLSSVFANLGSGPHGVHGNEEGKPLAEFKAERVLVPGADAFAAVAELQMLPGAGDILPEAQARQRKGVAWGRFLATQRPSWEYKSKTAYVIGPKEELSRLLALAPKELRSQIKQLAIPGDAQTDVDVVADFVAQLHDAEVVITPQPSLALMAAGMEITAILVTGMEPLSATDARELGGMVWVQDVSNTTGVISSLLVDHPPDNPGEDRRRQLRQVFFRHETCDSLCFFRLYTSGQERTDIMAAIESCT